MIYSEYLECMIPSGFTIQKVHFDKQGKSKYLIGKSMHYTWNEENLVYCNDIVDDIFVFDIPKNGSKSLSLKLGCKCRILVKIDK